MGEYYGQINEIKLGLSDQVPEKPEAKRLYDQIKEFGIPLVAGGVLDQPYIFMQEYRVVDNMDKQMKLVEALNSKAQSTSEDLL